MARESDHRAGQVRHCHRDSSGVGPRGGWGREVAEEPPRATFDREHLRNPSRLPADRPAAKLPPRSPRCNDRGAGGHRPRRQSTSAAPPLDAMAMEPDGAANRSRSGSTPKGTPRAAAGHRRLPPGRDDRAKWGKPSALALRRRGQPGDETADPGGGGAALSPSRASATRPRAPPPPVSGESRSPRWAPTRDERNG